MNIYYKQALHYILYIYVFESPNVNLVLKPPYAYLNVNNLSTPANSVNLYKLSVIVSVALGSSLN